MTILTQTQNAITYLILNRPEKHNAFNEHVIESLTVGLTTAIEDPNIHVIVLKANGKHFSAGADLDWMSRMANATNEENRLDAQKLAKLLHTLYHSPKPTIAQVQGKTFGGGVGLIAACDIAITEPSATFCFSEVKLGLIPATISPFVIKAMGSRAARWLFLSADNFDAQTAQRLQLIHYVVQAEELNSFTTDYALKLAALPINTLKAAKALVDSVEAKQIDERLLEETAMLIAKQRGSEEAKRLIAGFLNKSK